MSWMGKHEKCFSFFDSFLAQGKSNLHCVPSRVLPIPEGVGLTFSFGSCCSGNDYGFIGKPLKMNHNRIFCEWVFPWIGFLEVGILSKKGFLVRPWKGITQIFKTNVSFWSDCWNIFFKVLKVFLLSKRSQNKASLPYKFKPFPEND